MATPRSQIRKRGMGRRQAGPVPGHPMNKPTRTQDSSPAPSRSATPAGRGGPGDHLGQTLVSPGGAGQAARGRPGCRRCGRQQAADGKHRPGAGTHGGLGLGREEGSKLDLPSLEQGAKCNKMKHDRANVAFGPAAPKPSGRAPDGAWSFSPTISSVRVSGVRCIPKGKGNSGCLGAA